MKKINNKAKIKSNKAISRHYFIKSFKQNNTSAYNNLNKPNKAWLNSPAFSRLRYKRTFLKSLFMSCKSSKDTPL